MKPRRPLRSVFIGNTRYLSVYNLGVAQAMGIRGHWHRTVSLFDPISSITKQVAEMAPDVIWTHMALWPPEGAASVPEILELLSYWKKRGTAVYLHDGDPRERDVSEYDVPSAFSIALVNRTVHGTHLGIPALKWPYAAMVQRDLATAVPPSVQHDLLFAGILRNDGLYGPRTTLVDILRERLGERFLVVCPAKGDVNNRMLAADIAMRTHSVLGFARPEVPGWIDTRVVQWPGVGGVLIHDDAGDMLVPDYHYLKFDRSGGLHEAAESVMECVARAKVEGDVIRFRAFDHVQKHHTWLQRVDVALEAFYGKV